MGLSIGGGLGPVRMRVGTRGISGGLGPISGGTSWRGRRRSSGSEAGPIAWLFMAAIVLAAVYYAAAWPYLLGKKLAGATNPDRFVLAWFFEALYIVAILLLIGVAVERRRQSAARDRLLRARQASQIEADAKAKAAASLMAARVAQSAERAAVARIVETYRERQGQPPVRYPLPAGVRGKAGEVLIASWDDAALLEPRVRHPGTAAEHSRTDVGQLLMTDRRLLFIGASRTCEWDFRHLVSIKRCPRGALLAVTNRQMVKGVQLPSEAAYAAFTFSLAAASGPPEGVDSLQYWLEHYQDKAAVYA